MPPVSSAGHDHHGHGHDRHGHAHHHAPRSGAAALLPALSAGRWSLLWWGLGARLMLSLALVAIVWVTILWALF